MSWQLEEIGNRVPDVRKLFDIKDIVFDKNWLMKQYGKESRNKDIYYMYRGVCKKGDENLIRKSGLRYDVTVIPPFAMGCEYVKTAGHYHPIAINDLSYPEVYQVIEGEAIFLIQKVENFDNFNLVDVAYAKAGEGDVFVIPPNFAHITINASSKTLVMANWIADNFESMYEPIKRMCGAAYFFTEDGWVRNHRYGLIPNLREIKCAKMPDMYNYVLDLKRLEFLKNPTVRPSQQGVPTPPEPRKPVKKKIIKEEKEPEEETKKEPVKEEKPKEEVPKKDDFKEELDKEEAVKAEKVEEEIVEEKAEEEDVMEDPAKEEPVREIKAEEEIEPEKIEEEEIEPQEEAIPEEPAPKEPEQVIPIDFPSEEIIAQEESAPQEDTVPPADNPPQANAGKYNPVGFWL